MIFGRVTVAYMIAAISITTSAALVLYSQIGVRQCEQTHVATNIEFGNSYKLQN